MTFDNPAPRRAIVFGLLALAAGFAQAQAWPQKSIKLLAPSTAGGPPDVYARALADHLAKSLGQPVIATGFLFICLLPSTVQYSIAFT